MIPGYESWKGGNMLYPLPAALVTCRDPEGRENVFTVAWTGTVCTNPPMVSISVRPSRYSYGMIHESGEFVLHLTTQEMARAVDYCGVCSGRDQDKFRQMDLKKVYGDLVKAPILTRSPAAMECRVRQEIALGSHHLFLAEVLAVHVKQELLDSSGRLMLEKSGLMVYAHGEYFALGKALGKFGFSVRKKKRSKKGKDVK